MSILLGTQEEDQVLDLCIGEDLLKCSLFLEENGSRVKTHNGWSMLMCAAFYDSVSLVELLLTRKAYESEHEVYSSVRLAIIGQSHLALEALLAHKELKWDLEDPAFQKSIHRAAQDHDCVAIELLCSHGLDPNCVDEYGSTPLHYAVEDITGDSINTLLQLGADPCVKNDEGRTAYDILVDTPGLSSSTGVSILLRHMAMIPQEKGEDF